MEKYQERVVKERDDLNDKIVRLVGFLYTDRSDEISRDERCRLESQQVLMQEYSRILTERIAAFR